MAALVYEMALQQLSRLSLASHQIRGIVTQASPLQFKASAVLSAMPGKKKKKKVDITLVNQREAKKKRRLEKHMRRLTTKGRVLKPVDEIDGDRDLLKTLSVRHREPAVLTHEESERRALLHKSWTRYRGLLHMNDMRALDMAEYAQQRALNELRLESEELYQQAIQIDPELVPFTATGPMYTPPITDYETPDGEYVDKTKTYYVPLPEGFKLKLR